MSFVVWQHHGKRWPRAIAHFEGRDLADAYARYVNKKNTGLTQWSEVRRHDGDES